MFKPGDQVEVISNECAEYGRKGTVVIVDVQYQPHHSYTGAGTGLIVVKDVLGAFAVNEDEIILQLDTGRIVVIDSYWNAGNDEDRATIRNHTFVFFDKINKYCSEQILAIEPLLDDITNPEDVTTGARVQARANVTDPQVYDAVKTAYEAFCHDLIAVGVDIEVHTWEVCLEQGQKNNAPRH